MNVGLDRKKWLGATLLACGLAAGVWSFSRWDGSGELLSQAVAGDSSLRRDASRSDDFIVHEWGTFTTYSGSDGGRLEFRPLFDDDLPPFVLDRSLGASSLSKVSYRAQVRMETPITYFYTEQPRDVRVRVRFPQGLLTEFYPPVAAVTPPYSALQSEPRANTALDWGTVHLIPESSLRPQLANAEVAAAIQKRMAETLPPLTDFNNHYAYARQTDSALVHVNRPNKHLWEQGKGDHFEKFLFYRGLGDFKLPLHVKPAENGRVQIENRGKAPISWLMLMAAEGEQVRYTLIPALAGGESTTVTLAKEFGDKDSMIAAITDALVSTGLYRREAEAMVNTWRTSWFGEQGTRLFYFVPEQLTNELLPLEIEPQPKETVRVLVGRMDLMTPEYEREVIELVRASAAARREFNETNQARLPFPVSEQIRQLGRLAEPALTRVRHVTGDNSLHYEATTLLRDLHQWKLAEEQNEAKKKP
jgi:hypothetical protein